MRTENYIFGLIIAFLVGVVVYAAVCNNITHDEAYTSYIAQFSLKGAMLMEDPNANNHILNTMFVMLFADKLFGVQEWTVRMGALIGFGFFIYAAFYLVKKYFNDTKSQILAFLLFFANPYLIEFFSLGRGYSLSIGLMLLSVLHFEFGINHKKMWLAYGAAALGVYANFTLLPYFISLVGVFYLKYGIDYFKNGVFSRADKPFFTTIFNDTKPILMVSLVLLVFAAIPIYQLKTHEQLYYGGEIGLWSDTIKSLAETLIYTPASPEKISFIAFLSGFLFFSVWFFVFYLKINKKSDILDDKNSPLLLLTMVLSILSLLFILFDTKLVVYRTALFLYPLFVAVILSLFRHFENTSAQRNWRFALLLPLSLGLSAHTFVQKRQNFHSYRDWQSDSETENAFLAFKKLPFPAASRDTLAADIFWLHSITFRFYADKHHIKSKFIDHFEIKSADFSKDTLTNWSQPYFIIEPAQFDVFKNKTKPVYKGKYLWILQVN